MWRQRDGNAHPRMTSHDGSCIQLTRLNVNSANRERRNPYNLNDLLYLMERLRDPKDGCPWDVKQTYQSIAPSTLEEAYEVVDAIEKGDNEHLKEELGDLLFQVIFYSQLGHEDNVFDFHSITSGLVDKLVRRHPHVFPQGVLRARFGMQQTAVDTVRVSWEDIKQQERKEKGKQSALADVPVNLPALSRAAKLQKCAAHKGFDWADIQGPIAKVREELEEVEQALAENNLEAITDEVGDLLFSVVNISRYMKIDPEMALRKANQKFENRFSFIEERLDCDMSEHNLDALTKLWDQAKKAGL